MSLFNLWLLSPPTGHTEPEVRQTPRQQVTEMGAKEILRCDPISGYLYLYWCRQILGQKVEFLVSFYKENILEKTETVNDRLSAKRPAGSFSTLQIQPTELGDSAMYLCASSSTTALKRCLQPAHKPSCCCLFSTSRNPFPAQVKEV